MKFKFGQEVDPKELLGMEPTELRDKLDKSVTKEDLTSLETKMTEVIKKSFENLQINAQPQPRQQQQQQQREEPISFVEDEDAAFNQRARPLAIASLTTQAELLKLTILQNKPYYQAFKQEVDALLNAQPIQYRANPESVENAYNVVLGKHIEDISSGKIKSSAQVESATNTGGNQQGQKKEGELFTAQELANAAQFGIDPLKAMKRLGIDEKKYKETRDKMVISI